MSEPPLNPDNGLNVCVVSTYCPRRPLEPFNNRAIGSYQYLPLATTSYTRQCPDLGHEQYAETARPSRSQGRASRFHDRNRAPKLLRCTGRDTTRHSSDGRQDQRARKFMDPASVSASGSAPSRSILAAACGRVPCRSVYSWQPPESKLHRRKKRHSQRAP